MNNLRHLDHISSLTWQRLQAKPFDFAFSPPKTALSFIDMQRFIEPGGFGETLGILRLRGSQ